MHETLAAVLKWFDADPALTTLLPGGLWVGDADQSTSFPFAILEILPSGDVGLDSEVVLEGENVELQVFASTRLVAMEALEELVSRLGRAKLELPHGSILSMDRGTKNVISEGKHAVRAFRTLTFTKQRDRNDGAYD